MTAIAPAQQPASWNPPSPPASWNVVQLPPSAPVPVVTGPGVTPSGTGLPAPVLQSIRASAPVHTQVAEKQIRRAWHWLAIVGTMYLVLGSLADFGYLDDFNSLFGGWGLAVGASFLVLAFFVRQGSIVAMGIAIAIYTAYTLAFFAAGSYAFLRIIVLAWLLRAFLAMYTLRQHRQVQAQQSSAPDQTRAA